MAIRTSELFNIEEHVIPSPTDLFPVDWSQEHSDAAEKVRFSKENKAIKPTGAVALDTPEPSPRVHTVYPDNPENHIG